MHSAPLKCTSHQGLQLQGTARLILFRREALPKQNRFAHFVSYILFHLVSYRFIHIDTYCFILFHFASYSLYNTYCFMLFLLASYSLRYIGSFCFIVFHIDPYCFIRSHIVSCILCHIVAYS